MPRRGHLYLLFGKMTFFKAKNRSFAYFLMGLCFFLGIGIELHKLCILKINFLKKVLKFINFWLY